VNHRSHHVDEDDAGQSYFGVPIPIACFVRLGATARREAVHSSPSPDDRSISALSRHAAARPSPIREESDVDRRVVDFAAS
jgi:hypothetical protein